VGKEVCSGVSEGGEEWGIRAKKLMLNHLLVATMSREHKKTQEEAGRAARELTNHRPAVQYVNGFSCILLIYFSDYSFNDMRCASEFLHFRIATCLFRTSTQTPPPPPPLLLQMCTL
jgi:hypothetical protein